MWALQEGWDNPNIFTLCKLAPSSSKISKLQQIGRGLRLAVNSTGQRITKNLPNFNFVNELNVIIPSTEGDFVTAIQSEISSHSLRKISKILEMPNFILNEIITSNPRTFIKLMSLLEAKGMSKFDDETEKDIVIADKYHYESIRNELQNLEMKNVSSDNLILYFDSVYNSENIVKKKRAGIKKSIKIDKEKYQQFKTLWENINRDAILRYEIDENILVQSAINRINSDFNLEKNYFLIETHKKVNEIENNNTETKSLESSYRSIFNIFEFIKELSNLTKLTYRTIATVLKGIETDRFDLIKNNENSSLYLIKDYLLQSIYETIENKISYDIKEIKVKSTSLTDKNSIVLDEILEGSCGVESYRVKDKGIIKKSLYDEDFIEVDSVIEKSTIDESNLQNITVFAKLPKIKIPVPNGTYNPDFGYVINSNGNKELYFIVETKGYDNVSEISNNEKIKINSAKKFFNELKELGINVQYKTKINNQQLSDLINDIRNK